MKKLIEKFRGRDLYTKSLALGLAVASFWGVRYFASCTEMMTDQPDERMDCCLEELCEDETIMNIIDTYNPDCGYAIGKMCEDYYDRLEAEAEELEQ